ncbi:MAG TPA: helix-turn-helix domain-containing protein [Polyangia bacterium]|nr:helix-turn-helix domain-containing protein [Polyangia bacterium]
MDVTAQSQDTAPTLDQLVSAFEGSDWNRGRAAKLLGISRGNFWRRVTRWPELYRLARVSLPLLLYEREACGGDLARLADLFGTTVPLLSRRLRTEAPRLASRAA